MADLEFLRRGRQSQIGVSCPIIFRNFAGLFGVSGLCTVFGMCSTSCLFGTSDLCTVSGLFCASGMCSTSVLMLPVFVLFRFIEC